MSPARRRKEQSSVPLTLPQPLTVSTGEQPTTIRELLRELKFPASEDPKDIIGTQAEKKAVRHWLKKMKTSKPPRQPNPQLLAQLWLRQWISEGEYEAYFPDRYGEENA